MVGADWWISKARGHFWQCSRSPLTALDSGRCKQLSLSFQPGPLRKKPRFSEAAEISRVSSTHDLTEKATFVDAQTDEISLRRESAVGPQEIIGIQALLAKVTL